MRLLDQESIENIATGAAFSVLAEAATHFREVDGA